MQYYPPSIPAIECPPLVPDNTPVLICPSCGDTMQHLRTIPKLGARLEQFIFVCPSCEQVEQAKQVTGGTSSAQTRNSNKVPGPNVWVRGTSVASRPWAMNLVLQSVQIDRVRHARVTHRFASSRHTKAKTPARPR